MRETTFWEDLAEDSEEYQLAYDLIRHAMWLVWESKRRSDLTRLKNVLEKASVFVNEELDELPDKTKELGLDEWQREERERQEEERLEQEEWEQEQREQEEEAAREDANLEAALASDDGEGR